MAGTGKTTLDWVRRLAPRANYCVAVGTCAAFGAYPLRCHFQTMSAGCNMATGWKAGRWARFSLAQWHAGDQHCGCAPHPGWIMETLGAIAFDEFGPADLDRLGRPRFYAKTLAHHGCDRNEYYEFKASAEKLSDLGCMMEHLRLQGDAGRGRLQPAWLEWRRLLHTWRLFLHRPEHRPVSRRQRLPQDTQVAGIPVGLPLDMPKAWFVALAALSKSATPDRVRKNATSDRVTTDPQRGKAGQT